MNEYYVYILSNKRNGTLYIGVTNDIIRRVYGHKTGEVDGFTKKYGVDRLVYYEQCSDVCEAIAREKQLKNWKRQWKIALIGKSNSDWKDRYPEISGCMDSGSSPE